MLPALDNLHRALDAAEHLPGEKNESFQHFYDGIALVSEQINDILNKMGIKPILSLGEEFDPDILNRMGIKPILSLGEEFDP
ncbi:nucleotide exchange factor GrpE, partial [Escherichia coli]|nr:nucleotide exchange factor GrpE [Escherichia coli]